MANHSVEKGTHKLRLWVPFSASPLRRPLTSNVRSMIFQRVTFTRLFQPSGNHFGFEFEGVRYFHVVAPGKPKIEQGMTVIALLESQNDFNEGSLLGWINCEDGSIACDSKLGNLMWFLVCSYFSFAFPMRAYSIIENQEVANAVALFVATMFVSFAARYLYLLALSFIVKRALADVRDFICSSSGPAAA